MVQQGRIGRRPRAMLGVTWLLLVLVGTAGCSLGPLAEWFHGVTSGPGDRLGTDPESPRIIADAVGQEVVQLTGAPEEGPLEARWWEWTAPETGPYTFATHSSEVDTTLVVYSSDDGVLTEIASNDDSGDVSTSDVTISAAEDDVFVVRVESKVREAAAITLSWYPPSDS